MKRRIFSVPIALLVLAIAAPAAADVQVREGPSPIPGANAQRAGDLTLRNSELAVTIAVETAPPYGVPPDWPQWSTARSPVRATR